MSASKGAELDALRDLSARVGRQRRFVQGSTGNTSIKLGQTLWVKASGKRLARAAEEEIFVPVDRAEINRYLGDAFCPVAQNGAGGLTPSIETAMHLVLPHRVVIHVHSISVLAWAVRCNSLAALRARMWGTRWAWIRYTPSGPSLARAIQSSLGSAPDVFVLANHGLVIGADDCRHAEARLLEVEERLAIEPRRVVAPDLASLKQMAQLSNFFLPDEPAMHSLATDDWSLKVVSKGVLYPCQAMFLGHPLCIALSGQRVSACVAEYFRETGFHPPAVLAQYKGVLVAKGLTSSETETLIGLAEVASRVPRDAGIAYLSERRVQQVMRSGSYGDARMLFKPGPVALAATGAAS